jgi:3-hydroxyisobutyrate dehydrogenase
LPPPLAKPGKRTYSREKEEERMANIGWIGTGVMGKSMCRNLMKAGHSAAVYTRTKAKAQELIDDGARWAESPSEAAAGADMLFTIVGYPSDVEEVYLGEKGVFAGAEKGMIAVDMTTSKPSLAEELAERGLKHGVSVLDAPVSGGDTGAREGKLAIMAGGDREAFGKVLPLFEVMGENIALMGDAGAGQHTKMCNQILIASTMIGTVESLMYGVNAGMSMDAVIDVIGKGAAASWSINNLGRRIAQGNFDPGFYIKHFIKDMGIALEEAKRMKLSLPGLSLAHQFYVAASACGYEELGTQGLYRLFERLNGLD